MVMPVKLEIFEGPLDLLLHLIRKNEVDIYDIPVALITGQYLEYLDMMREMNINLAGEFLVMASTLTQIKSRMLLPSHQAAEEEEEAEDPRQDLIEQLKEHMRIKAAADKLEARPRLDRDVFARGGGAQEVEKIEAEQEELFAAGLFDLVEAFRHLLKEKGHKLNLALPGEGTSLEDRITQLLDMLKTRQSLLFEECFIHDKSRAALVVTFLALLEITRLGLIRVYQHRLERGGDARTGYGALRIYFRPQEDNEEEAER
jgi:segregation and condensation protein A